MEVADGNLALELPASGSTIQKPPDGGAVAWRVVGACATLNACSTTCLLILTLTASGLKKELGEDVADSITTACQDIRLLAAPLAAIAIVLLGYRKVAVIGSIMVSVGFFISGFLTSDLSGLMGLLLGGVAGLGLALWYLCAIIPILEYFQRRRLLALMLSNLGSLLVTFLISALYVVLIMLGEEMAWNTAFKCMVIPGAVGLSVSYYLKPLHLQVKDTPGRTFVEMTLGIVEFKVFKEITLYLVMLVYFFDQFGRSIQTPYISALMMDKSFGMWETTAQSFLTLIGMGIGFMALICWKTKGLVVALLVWGTMDLVVGFLTLQMPSYDKFGWIAVYSILFGFTQAIVSSLLNDTVPETFGVRNTRLVAGLLGFAAGLGAIIASPAAEDANNKDEGDDYSAALYLAASMLLAAGLSALLSRYLLTRKIALTNKIGNDGTHKRKQQRGDNSNGHATDGVLEDVPEDIE